MRKNLIGFVIVILIYGSIPIFANVTDKTVIAKSDQQIKNELEKSMEETKKQKEKLELLFIKSSKELNDKGYEVGLSYSHADRMLTAQIKDEAIKSQIENIIADTAKEVEFGDFEIKFRVLDSKIPLNKEDEKLRESIDKVSNVVSDVLKDKGYDFAYSILVKPEKEIIIEATDKGLAEDDELENLISNAILSETNMDFTVKLEEKSESEIRDMEWHPVFAAIMEETSKKFKEYRGFASSFHPMPLQIIIKTTINDSWFVNADRKVKQMENYVGNIIELKMEELSIGEVPYEIIIRDKGNERIN
ncbi:hypothetical protein [Lentibacillus sediminis]|uniref:hypothetical protein n=1 Tax=Lentibacillus sediminis TaxID=1940529 RepID=UPI001EFCF3FE|nr:hypothetical protein [Lentibacillus sediminis]